MKILRIDRMAAEWPAKAVEALSTPDATPAGVLPARIISDSAIVRNNRPVFIPDFAREGWVVDLVPAFLIGRLGKFISPRFVERHLSTFTLVACLRPANVTDSDALTDSFDGAITVGETMQIPVGDKIILQGRYSSLPVKADDKPKEEVKTVEISVPELHVEDTVALLSRYMMLKSGDMILPASVGLTFQIALDYSVSASVDNVECLTLRLK